MSRSVIVTGAAGGIGASVVEWFHGRGWVVVAVDLHAPSFPAEVIALQGDVTAPGVLETAVERATSDRTQLAALVNSAVQRDYNDVLSSTDADWQRVFEINVIAAVRAMRLVLPHMLKQGAGSIVNVSSVAGLSGLRRRAAYCSSKGALIALTKQAALDYASAGIKINCVCPGATNTAAIRSRFAEFGPEDSVAGRFGSRQALGRLVEPEEVASVIGYLCSDAPPTLNGLALVIDGGSSLLTPADLSYALEHQAEGSD